MHQAKKQLHRLGQDRGRSDRGGHRAFSLWLGLIKLSKLSWGEDTNILFQTKSKPHCKLTNRFINIFYIWGIFFLIFTTAPETYGSSWARGWIRAAAEAYTPAMAILDPDPSHICHLYHSCSNAPDSYSTELGQGWNPHPHRDNVRSSTCWATMGTPILGN